MTPPGVVMARAFIADRRHPSYAGRLSLEETARYVIQGNGTRGSCREYLERTLCELHKLGLGDGLIHPLEAKVRELTGGERPCGVAGCP